MNTHDIYIELPAEFRSGNSVPVAVATIKRERMEEILREAIEADRKRRTPPNEPFAIVIDRMYDGEGPSLAYWNGENYQFTDGDCYEREGDTLDGYTAEFLTDHQLEKRLFDDRKRRGEPVAYGIKAANTGKIVTVLYGSDVDQVGEYRADLVVPLYTTPQPAEPADVDHGETRVNIGLEAETGSDLGGVIDHGEAEPVKVPSDGDILQVWAEEVEDLPLTRAESSRLIRFAHALLSRYGRATATTPATPAPPKPNPIPQPSKVIK